MFIFLQYLSLAELYNSLMMFDLLFEANILYEYNLYNPINNKNIKVTNIPVDNGPNIYHVTKKLHIFNVKLANIPPQNNIMGKNDKNNPNADKDIKLPKLNSSYCFSSAIFIANINKGYKNNKGIPNNNVFLKLQVLLG